MNTYEIENGRYENESFGVRAQHLVACTELETVFAETLLDQVEEAQSQIQGLSDDIALLQTAENALDLIAESLAKIRRLTLQKHQGGLSHCDQAEINDSINNLIMVTMLVAEDAEYNGHRLFTDDVIQLNGCGSGDLFLATSRLPQVQGLENNDCEAVLDCLSSAARVINRQYYRIGSALRTLLYEYDHLRSEIEMIIGSHTCCEV